MIGIQIIAVMADTKLPQGSAQVVAQEATAYLQSVRPGLINEVRSRMRVGVSEAIGVQSERESVRGAVTTGMAPTLRVSSSSIKAMVDENGRRPGSLPPFGPQSLLREWVIGILNPEPRAVHAITKRIAYNILERGLPRPGDPIRTPFRTTFEAELPRITEGLRRAGANAFGKINQRVT